MKWEWASRVLWFLLFLMSHTLRVLSSEALRIYLPPGWNTSPLTQLSCPVCTKIQRVFNIKYQPWKQSFLKMNLVVMALKKIFQKEHWKVDNHLYQDLIKDNYGKLPFFFLKTKSKCLLKQNHGWSSLYSGTSSLTKVNKHSPTLTSHILIVLSRDPDIKNGPDLFSFLF